MSSSKCVSQQIQYLILSSIFDDPDYQSSGIAARNLLVILCENKAKWLQVGVERANKSFEKRIRWALSALVKSHALQCSGNGTYRMGKQFHEVLKELTYDLCEKLEVQLDFCGLDCEEMEQLSTNRERLMKSLDNGTVAVRILESERDKQLHLFTAEQVTRLARHSVGLQIYSYA